MDPHFEIFSLPENMSQDVDFKFKNQQSPVKASELSLISLEHYDFLGEIQVGEMIVHKALASNLVEIFKELFQIKFPLNSAESVSKFNWDDDLSMDSNNSYCFFPRTISGTQRWSMHAFGAAIDINPIQNPCLYPDEDRPFIEIKPAKGSQFLNRRNLRDGMVEPIVDIFFRHGFVVWGGNWNTPVDFHHFQVAKEDLSKFIENGEALKRL